MATNYLLVKHNIEDLYKSKYRGAVFVPVDDDMDSMPDGFVSATMSWTKNKIRTTKQNSSIHLYCKLIAKKMENAGIDLQTLMKFKKVSVPVTTDVIKEVVWRPIQIAMFNKVSTTKLDTDQVSKVHRVVDRHMAETFNISEPFPDKRPQYYEKKGYNNVR